MTRTEIRRLAFAAFWAMVAIALMVRRMSESTDALPDGDPSPKVDMGTMVALALCAWNMFLWFLALKSRPVSVEDSPLPRKRPLAPSGEERKFEYIPELDFNKPPEPEPSGLPPADSRNGNHAHPPEEPPPVNRFGG